MSKIICLLAVLCSCLYVGHAAVPHLGTHFKEAVADSHTHELLHKQLLKSAHPKCPNFENKMKNATRETQQCVEKHFDPVENSICHFVKTQLKPCANPITTLMGHCMPEKSRDMGEFLVDSFVNIFDVVCHAKGYELFELFNPCITHSMSDSDDNPCKLELEMKLAQYEEDFPTKEEFCRFQSNFKTCLQKQLDKHCTSTITKENFFNFYDKLHSTCNIV